MKTVEMTKSNTNQHKRMAAGQPVTGLKDGGKVGGMHEDAAKDRAIVKQEIAKAMKKGK